jgi:hypothetical protein
MPKRLSHFQRRRMTMSTLNVPRNDTERVQQAAR